MGIDYGKLRNLDARKITSALTRDGFWLDSQSGSHKHYVHHDGRRVTVTFHARGAVFKMKTLKSMLETQAGWTDEDLKRLKLLK